MAVKDGLPSTDFSRMNREYIKAVAGESGGGLPEITEADEGKVLTVESGEAAWAAASGGGDDIYVINISTTETKWIMDKTFAEIAAAVKAKKICYTALFEEDEEAGYFSYDVNIVTSVLKDPNHAEPDTECNVYVGQMMYECDSANEYPYMLL